jgi:hypothetical protein
MHRPTSLALATSSVILGIAWPSQAQDAVEWRVKDGGNGHWYGAFVSPSVSFSAARAAALASGGDLVSINTAAESSFVFGHIASQPELWWPSSGQRHGPWIGLIQDTTASDYSEPGGGWRWVDGTPLSFNRWAQSGTPCENQPNDCRCNGPCGLGYAAYYCPLGTGVPCGIVDTWATMFNDMGGFINGAIIEWAADCNEDGIVDYGQVISGELSDLNGNHVPDACECIADINHDGAVDGRDIGELLGQWGGPGSADVSRDGAVTGTDLTIMLSAWGPCRN